MSEDIYNYYAINVYSLIKFLKNTLKNGYLHNFIKCHSYLGEKSDWLTYSA